MSRVYRSSNARGRCYWNRRCCEVGLITLGARPGGQSVGRFLSRTDFVTHRRPDKYPQQCFNLSISTTSSGGFDASGRERPQHGSAPDPLTRCAASGRGYSSACAVASILIRRYDRMILNPLNRGIRHQVLQPLSERGLLLIESRGERRTCWPSEIGTLRTVVGGIVVGVMFAWCPASTKIAGLLPHQSMLPKFYPLIPVPAKTNSPLFFCPSRGSSGAA